MFKNNNSELELVTCEIVKLNLEHCTEVLEIASNVFGKDYLNIEKLEVHIESPTHFGIVAIILGKVQGFCLYQVFAEDSLLMREIPSPFGIVGTYYSYYSPIGYLKLIGVKQPQQRKGIGTQMVEAFINHLKPIVKSMVCTAWCSKNGTPIASLLDKAQFNPLTEIENYWYTKSMKEGYHCAVCGAPPCRCAVIIYGLFF